MLTIDSLKEYGANVEEGLTRCVNRESLYLRLVGKAAVSPDFERLETAIDNRDYEDAFQAAHGLKGVVNNLALTPLKAPIEEITEHLRAKEEIDYSRLLAEIKDAHDRLKAIVE
ncbi:MAG: Hpt domain-containing protein [Bacilli bacterium]|nr:Hpt domain-containing protein [Bacilli bacterium]